ncbi:hypothetical protein KAU32_03240 [bacterium]|nr:hypothetical protein [bacterium]
MRRAILVLMVVIGLIAINGAETLPVAITEDPVEKVDPFDIWGDEGVLEAVIKENIDIEEKTLEQYLNVEKSYFYFGQRGTEKKSKLSYWEKTCEWADKGLAVFPESVDMMYYKAAAYGRIGETKGVLKSLFLVKPIRELCEKIFEIDPDHAGAHLIMGKMYRKLPGWKGGDIDKSLELLKRAVELEPDYSGHYLALANTKIEKKMYKEAAADLQKIIDDEDFRDKTQMGRDKASAKERLEKISKHIQE